VLELVIKGEEFYDNETEKFFTIGDDTVLLEHSLASVSKWESHFEKPFLSSEEKTPEEWFWYVEAMTLTPIFSRGVFLRMSKENIQEINTYINARRTGTWFNEGANQRRATETITAELVYYWMITLNIPFECQYWHFNKLLTLIKVCNLKNAPEKKMTAAEVAQRNRTLNQQRKEQLKTAG
jgi:hypothetical protein